MPRAEFATHVQGTQHTAQPGPVADGQAASSASTRSEPGLHILLIDDDAAAAQGLRARLHDIFGADSASDWMSDRAEGAALLAQNQHDVCILTANDIDETITAVRASVGGGSTVPIVVLTRTGAATDELKLIEAGAAAAISAGDTSPQALERNVRQAVLSHDRLIRAHREIDTLATEKTRLNLLRDANHRFVENACHDFRSPLTVIKEFSSIIAEGLAGDVNEEQAEFLDIILTRVDQLSQMVDGILDASRLESDLIGVRREEHDVAALIENIRPTLERAAAMRKVSAEFSVPATLPRVFADAESVGRVLTNLGANACKYAGESGKIRVWARYDEEAREVMIGVTDSGPGISPEHVKIIFDRFQQIPDEAQREKGGFGLGLHIASEFVRINFGTLSVESEPGKGSTFTFTIPIFDVNALIPLHFNFLKTSRHAFQNVALMLATSDGASPTLSDAEKLMNRQLRSYDLLLRLRPGSWLVCIASDEPNAQTITERILDAYAQASRNRPDGPLPELRFRPIGTWPLASRLEAINDAIRGVYPETRAEARPETQTAH